MIITEILCKTSAKRLSTYGAQESGIAERVSDKTEEIIILEKFFASKAAKPSAWIKFVLIIQIRFKRKNSFPKEKNLRFQKNHPFVSRKTFQEKRLIRFLEPRACI